MPGAATSIELLYTERLVCRRLRAQDEADICRLMLDPAVTPTTWPFARPPTPGDVREALSAKLEHWERHGFGLWLVLDRASGAMVGRGGLQHTSSPALNAVEVAWAIVPERWGQGLATELARAALDAAFAQLRLLEVVAMTLPDNLASRRVMEKAGLVHDGEVEHAGLPHVLYRARAATWRTA